MTVISGQVKPVDYHPDASQPTVTYSASAIDFFTAGRRRLPESAETGKKAAIEQEHRRALYWLISAALISLLVGILCLMESVTPRTAGTDQLDLAAEGAPSHVEVTIDQAIQALSVRH